MEQIHDYIIASARLRLRGAASDVVAMGLRGFAPFEVEPKGDALLTVDTACEAMPEECEYEMLRVYVKHEAGWQQVEAWLRENYPCPDVAFVVADICREELLIEIEGIAKKK